MVGRDRAGSVWVGALFISIKGIKWIEIWNRLTAEGIKKINELTAKQNILSNDIKRDEQMTIKQQDVEAQEDAGYTPY